MRLFIAEKPELANVIVDGLGGGVKRRGYYEAGDDIVTWCFGHMLEMCQPHEYDERYKKWVKADLPWIAVPWRKKPIEKSADQLTVIFDLLKRSTSVVHAGDPDHEGQLLVDEILEFVSYKNPVQRVIINDNTLTLVKRALANLRDNTEQQFAGWFEATDARSWSDQFFGVNASRLYTLQAQEVGYQGVLHVGRVQTPIMGLVVRRCREHAAHSAAFYYNVVAQFNVEGIAFPARYKVQETDAADEKGRLRDESQANAIAASVAGKGATITTLSTARDKEKAAPLPYNLLKLQTDASRKFGYKPDRVLEITQSLREKHKLITYNRSDSEYLSDEQHIDAPAVLAAIAHTAPGLSVAIERADPKLKSRAFNSKKVSAHHAIIPTQTKANLAALSEPEQKIYLLIARAYVAQFWPLYVYDQTKLEVVSEGRTFVCSASVPKQQGWKTLYKNDDGNEDLADDEDELAIDIRALKNGMTGQCVTAVADQKKTKPQPLYTMAALLTDLTRVAKYIKDEKLRKLMIEKDKDKAGEHGGIGTPATRSAIIAKLFEDEYLAEEKNGNTLNVVATKKGYELYDVLPDGAKFPDMTALWHEQLKRIETGELDKMVFIDSMVEYMRGEIARVSAEGLNIDVQVFPCQKCKKPMRRIKSKTAGYFWACSDFEACKHFMDDRNGKPVARVPQVVSTVHKCQAPGCGKGLIQRFDGRVPPGKKTAPPWWSCSGYPDCKQSYPDHRGRPNYEPRKAKA